MTDYDVVVVGARCAGSATALELARCGYDVLVVDRARFPSDTLSTHYVQQRGASKLAEWGLLRRLERAGAPLVPSNRWVVDGIEVEGTPPAAAHASSAIGPRRRLLDGMLVDAARDAGADVREGFTVERLLWRDDRVAGVSGRDADGEAVDVEAAVVVGADGRYSRVADEVDAETIVEKPVITCVYYSYWDGVELDRQEIHAVRDLGVAVFPTDGGLVNVSMARPRDRFEEVRGDVAGSFERDLARLPDVAALLEGGERVAPYRGTGDLPNYLREAWGPGWVLVGDAVHHKDPVLAQGMSDALVQGGTLAAALDAGLGGDRPLAGALEEYAEGLREMLPMFELNARLARLAVDDESRTLFRAFGSSRRNADRFLGTIAGTVPVEDFWDRSNLRRLVLRSAASRVGRRVRSAVGRLSL
ncbi:MAG: NAD(P)/FAD-dependent oxidoreductase [Salinigranum sp.]